VEVTDDDILPTDGPGNIAAAAEACSDGNDGDDDDEMTDLAWEG